MTNEEIKLIALDVDGTIMNKQFQISDRVKNTIAKATEKGVRVVIATGRMYSSAVPVGQELKLKTPLIVYQGSMVREFYNSDKMLLHHHLEEDISYQIVRDARDIDIQINVYLDDKLYLEGMTPIVKNYVETRSLSTVKVDNFEAVEEFLPTKILLMDPDPEKINKVVSKFKAKYSDQLYITKSTDYFCEFVNKKCSKAGGIKFLADQWGIEQSQVMAIGDHDNDKEMIGYAGMGVVMGNGTKNVQKYADYITKTVDEDGVAHAIEKFVL